MESLILAFFSGGALATLILAIKELVVYFHKNHISKVLRATDEIYDKMQNLKSNLRASRITVCCTHNGSGVPRVGHLLKITMAYEVYDAPTKGMKEYWKQRELDPGHIKLLATMDKSADSMLINAIDQIPASTIKSIWVSEEVNKVLLMKIKENRDRYYYLLAEFTRKDMISMGDVVSVQNFVQELSQLL